MSNDLSRKQKRVRDRRIEVIKEAIRSRKFSNEEMTKQAVNFLLTGLRIEKNRDEIVSSAKID